MLLYFIFFSRHTWCKMYHWVVSAGVWLSGLQKDSQWAGDRGRGSGATVRRGWNNKHNFRVETCRRKWHFLFDHVLFKYAWTAATAAGFEPRPKCKLCVFDVVATSSTISQNSDSCRLSWSPVRSNKQILRLCASSQSLSDLCTPTVSLLSWSATGKHIQSICISSLDISFSPYFYLFILSSFLTPCNSPLHFSISLYIKTPGTPLLTMSVGERIEEEDLCPICLSNDQWSGKD